MSDFDSIKREDVTAPNLGTRLNDATHAVRVLKGEEKWAPASDLEAYHYSLAHGSENVRVIEGPLPERRVWLEEGSAYRSLTGRYPQYIVRVDGAWADQWGFKPFAEEQVRLLKENPSMSVYDARMEVVKIDV